MRFWLFPLAAVLVLCSAGAFAATDREVYIYRGESIADLGITVGSWGSGRATESAEKVLTGSKSLKLTTQSLYSGARIDFPQPVTLFTDGIDTKRYVLFTFYFNEVQQVDPAAGSPYAYEVEPYNVPKASLVRFVFASDSGQKLSVDQIANPLDPDDNWVRIAVPLAKFKALEGVTEFRLKRLVVSTDIPSTLYLGEIKLVTDSSPITVGSLSSQTVAIYDEVLLNPESDGGVSSLKYSWDFNAANGIQPESNMRVGRYVYVKGGDYDITLTVSDADGIKSPVTVKTTVTVTD